MIENTLIQSNFIGRDGFPWWVGQVAPEDVQGDQINGGGWGDRLKVRILGYHPDNDVELKNEELPWAHILKSPEAGSGRAGRGKPPKISPGDMVLGFFLDGDNAQQPVILGVFSSSTPAAAVAKDKPYTQPFVPFTGYTSKVKPNDNIAQSEAGDQNSASSPTNRQVDSSTAKKIEEATGKVTRTASTVLGTTITAGDASGPRSSINKINSTIQNSFKDFKAAVPKDKLKILNNTSRDLANTATGMSASMITSTFDDMAPKLNDGLKNLYKSEYGKVLKETMNPAMAKQAAKAAQIAKVPAILNIENAIPCMMKNVTDKLQGNIASLLSPFLENVVNITPCIVDQFTAGILNSIIGSIDEALAPLMGDVADIFPGNISDMLRSKAEGLLGLSQLLECDLPTAADSLSGKTNQWVIGKGPKSVPMPPLESLATKLLGVANAAQSIQEAAGAPGGIVGNLLSGVDIPGVGAFDFMSMASNEPGFNSALGDCYTGPPLDCSGINVKIFGGGGEGATGAAIVGALVGDTFAEQTGSLIGIDMTNGGGNYTSEPFVEIIDTCNQGYGAIANAVIDYDPQSPTYQQVTDIYVVNGGENYPVNNPNNVSHTIDHVVVVNPGENYKNDDVVTDNSGNVYDLFLDENGKILNVIPPNPQTNNVKEITEFPELNISTETGFGAILSPILSPRPSYQGEIKQVIDCITPRDGIVGFVNGDPYYGPFHVHPATGAKMVGSAHTTSAHAIIYDTPQESRTSRGLITQSTSFTTVSSPTVQTNVSDTPVQSIPSVDTSTSMSDPQPQQPSQPTYTPPPSSSPSGGGSSGSGGSGSSGGGGYGGGY